MSRKKLDVIPEKDGSAAEAKPSVSHCKTGSPTEVWGKIQVVAKRKTPANLVEEETVFAGETEFSAEE